MTHRSHHLHHATPRPALLLAALVATLLPLSTAAAQDLPRVRVTRDDTTVRAMRTSKHEWWLLTRAEAGTLYDVLMAEGDRTQYRESNWYLVALPRDQWGTSWAGWVTGRNVAPAPPRERAAAQPAAVEETVAAPTADDVAAAERLAASRAAAASAATSASTTAPGPVRVIPDVVLQFAFDRSDLSEAAKHALTTSLAPTRPEAGSLSFALGGHTDAMGPDDYNHKLGLARADAVRKYIVEQLQVPADRVSVSSYGETQPVAPNDTRPGRAENRRVVVTVTR